MKRMIRRLVQALPVLLAVVLTAGVLLVPALLSAAPVSIVGALLQDPGPGPIVVLIAMLLRVVIPTAAAWLFTEYTKGVGFINRLGALGVGAAGVIWGFLGSLLAGVIPGFELPAGFTDLTAQGIAGALSGLVTLITHVQSTAAARAASRRSRGMKY
jgi:membrane protease YdiL (CAAX protease family)